jgi:hypothetical protein
MEQLVFAAPLPSPLTLDLGYLLLLSVLLAMGLAAVAYAVFRWITAEPQSPALARRMRFRKRHRAVDIGGGLVSRVFVAGAAALVAGAYFTGGFDAFRDVETARAALAAWGTRAYVLYFVSFSLLEPLGVPALLFILPAGIVWGPWTAFALSLPAGVCAGIVGFVFATPRARLGRGAPTRTPAPLRRAAGREWPRHGCARAARLLLVPPGALVLRPLASALRRLRRRHRRRTGSGASRSDLSGRRAGRMADASAAFGVGVRRYHHRRPDRPPPALSQRQKTRARHLIVGRSAAIRRTRPGP